MIQSAAILLLAILSGYLYRKNSKLRADLIASMEESLKYSTQANEWRTNYHGAMRMVSDVEQASVQTLIQVAQLKIFGSVINTFKMVQYKSHDITTKLEPRKGFDSMYSHCISVWINDGAEWCQTFCGFVSVCPLHKASI